jgi:hypothetical protein
MTFLNNNFESFYLFLLYPLAYAKFGKNISLPSQILTAITIFGF